MRTFTRLSVTLVIASLEIAVASATAAGCSSGASSTVDAGEPDGALLEAGAERQADAGHPEAASDAGARDAVPEATDAEAQAGIDAGLTGRLAYASGSVPQNLDYAQIYTWDLSGGTPVAITKTIFTAVSQVYPRWSANGTRVFFQQLKNTAADSSTLMESDADGGNGTTIGPCGTHQGGQVLCMDPVRAADGTVLFVADTGYGYEIDAFPAGGPDGGAAVSRIVPPTGCGISTLSVTPDGSQLAMAVFGADVRCPAASIGLYVLPSNATALTTPLPLGDTTWTTTYGFAQIDTAGTRIYYVAVNGSLRSCALDGSNAKTEVPATVFHSAGNGETGLSRDELSVSDRGAFFVDPSSESLVFYPFGATAPVTVVANLGPSGIAWSP
jgi:hypothetical protein